MKLFITYAVVILVAIGLGFFLFQSSKDEGNRENLPGEAVAILGQEHVPEGVTDPGEYNSNPPTSGWHWPAPAACRVYDPNPEPDQRYIHNLEHGSIWISYKSSVDQKTKTLLQDFVRRYSNVVVTVRDANDSNIALAAWGRLLKLESYDENQIISFINSFVDKGPERVQCAR